MATSSDLPFFLLLTVVKVVVVLVVLLTAIAYAVWVERKVVARLQSRWGPYRVGPHGLLQPVADGLKILVQGRHSPARSGPRRLLVWPLSWPSRWHLLSIAVIPFGESITFGGHTIPFQITNLNVGLLFILAVTSLGVYGIALAGWSSNSKYPLFGGLRSSAQMISYELSLGLGGRGSGDGFRQPQPARDRRA